MYNFIYSRSEFVHLEIDLMIEEKFINKAVLLALYVSTIYYLPRKLLGFFSASEFLEQLQRG